MTMLEKWLSKSINAEKIFRVAISNGCFAESGVQYLVAGSVEDAERKYRFDNDIHPLLPVQARAVSSEEYEEISKGSR